MPSSRHRALLAELLVVGGLLALSLALYVVAAAPMFAYVEVAARGLSGLAVLALVACVSPGSHSHFLRRSPEGRV